MAFEVLALGGDGIGPEVMAAGLAVATAAADSAGIRREVTDAIVDALVGTGSKEGAA